MGPCSIQCQASSIHNSSHHSLLISCNCCIWQQLPESSTKQSLRQVCNPVVTDLSSKNMFANRNGTAGPQHCIPYCAQCTQYGTVLKIIMISPTDVEGNAKFHLFRQSPNTIVSCLLMSFVEERDMQVIVSARRLLQLQALTLLSFYLSLLFMSCSLTYNLANTFQPLQVCLSCL